MKSGGTKGIVRIKDLTGEILEGLKVKTTNGVVGYWASQWQKGVWLRQFQDPSKNTRIYPQFVERLSDCLNWEITEEEANCHYKLEMKDIDNREKKDEDNKDSGS
jgi:ribonuclease HI